MSKALTALAGTAAVLIVSACTSTFLVVKNGKGFHLGSESAAAYTILCESGDLERILADSGLEQQRKDDIFRYNCTDRSKAKIKEIYAGLTSSERKDLRKAFKMHGYEINAMLC